QGRARRGERRRRVEVKAVSPQRHRERPPLGSACCWQALQHLSFRAQRGISFFPAAGHRRFLAPLGMTRIVTATLSASIAKESQSARRETSIEAAHILFRGFGL